MLAVPSDAGDPLAGLCRVCAAHGEPLTYIFDQHFQHKIQVCLRLIVEETDHFPNTLCGPCAARLDTSYELVQRCARGQQKLQRILGAPAEISTAELKAENKDCDDSDSNSSHGPMYTTLEPLYPEGSEAIDCSASNSSGWSGNLDLLAEAVEHQSRLEPGTSTSSRSAKELSCEYCSKLFHHTGDLNKHRRSHTGERPYPCSVCEKRFSHISNLLRHMKIHSGERPFKCDLCQRCFSRSDKLMSHATTCSRRRSQ